MNTLKPCPFCGSRDIDDEPVLCMVYCTNCDAQINSTEVDWNDRPIEDDLRKRIAELEALVNVSEGLYERIYEQAARIAELEAENDHLQFWLVSAEGEIDQLTAHSDIERQDDKSPNDTQTQTIVYGKEREE